MSSGPFLYCIIVAPTLRAPRDTVRTPPTWSGAFGWGVLVSSGLNMVRTKADSVPGAYRKVVASRAPRKVLGSSTSATNSKSPSSRKAENKYAGGNPVCVRPTPKWQKGIGEFFRLSSKDSEKENRILEEAGSSGLGKAKRKARPLQPDHTDDENE
ncbi:PCNA-associated factor isoform X2 [Tupaia chinensis]|uniref:PCNA-associated factor isoform X2 n=1 Tax=Tupaia chinensis TaxID=246437 RepID=UPI0003C8D170|nr:PCNA-associated factor isoform X2 [Tupaia chinensis]